LKRHYWEPVRAHAPRQDHSGVHRVPEPEFLPGQESAKAP
jgi:hypothetical protein